MDWRNVSLSVLLVGVLCLPAPLYLPLGVDAVTVDRTSAPYHGTPANESDTDHAERVQYEALSPAAQRAVDRIIDNTSHGYGDYRPRTDNPIVEREPLVVERNGTAYYVRRDGGTYLGEEFGYFIYGLGVAGIGVVVTLVGAGGYLWCRRKAD